MAVTDVSASGMKNIFRKAGPDGGNGARGGSVIIRADKQLNTLLDFKYRRNYRAQRGENGRGKDQEGKSGKDEVIKVPCGTLVRDASKGKTIVDLVNDGDEFIIAHGGKGGRGNGEFATPTNQAPRFAEPGTSGEERELILELKLLADVGLVGFPNTGKSTLISVISAAKPKIADYPFTTLTPHLCLVRYAEGNSFVIADIPKVLSKAHTKAKDLVFNLFAISKCTHVPLFPSNQSTEIQKEIIKFF